MNDTCGNKGTVGSEVETCEQPATLVVRPEASSSGDPEPLCGECGYWLVGAGVVKPLAFDASLLEPQHRDDGQCHEACWQAAVAEFEAPGVLMEEWGK